MLNHSRFPDGMPLPSMPAQSSRRARGAPTARFAVRLRVALRFAQQPTGLTLPFGALMVSLPSQISAFCALAARSPCICSRLRVALPPLAATAHRADASLRRTSGRFGPSAQVPTGHTLPSAPAGVWGRLPVANLRGGRWPRPPLVSLPTFGSLCHLRWQVPTGHALPFGAPSPVPQHSQRAFRAAEGRKKRGLMQSECLMVRPAGRRPRP